MCSTNILSYLVFTSQLRPLVKSVCRPVVKASRLSFDQSLFSRMVLIAPGLVHICITEQALPKFLTFQNYHPDMARSHDGFMHTSLQFMTGLHTGMTRLMPMRVTKSCKSRHKSSFSVNFLRKPKLSTIRGVSQQE